MRQNHIAVLDLETTGLSPIECGEHKRAQITEISITMLDARTLDISKNNCFNSLVWIEQDENKCEELGLSPLSEEIAEKTHKSYEELAEAPTLDIVWKKMCQFLDRFTTGAGPWNRPILSGWNTDGYDIKILNEICKEKNQWDDKYQQNTLFHPRDHMDGQVMMYWLFENVPGINSLSLDNTRELFGLPETSLNHTARIDTLESALIIQRILRWLRKISSKGKFEQTMASVDVNDYL